MRVQQWSDSCAAFGPHQAHHNRDVFCGFRSCNRVPWSRFLMPAFIVRGASLYIRPVKGLCTNAMANTLRTHSSRAFLLGESGKRGMSNAGKGAPSRF